MTCCLQWIIKVIGSYHLMSWLILISSQLQNCPVLLAWPRNPLWGFQCRVHLFHQLLLENSRSSKLLAKDNQVVFPSWTWGFIPNWLDLSISEKSLAWLFIPNCWWVNVAPFPETSEGPGLTCPGEPPSWVATTYIYKSWLNWATKLKKKHSCTFHEILNWF